MTRVDLQFDLETYVDERRGRVERALERVLDRALDGAPEESAEVIRYACAGSAKRMRPILTCAVYETLGGRHAVEGLACAVEVIHGYSLMHDDLPSMDDDDLRRGRPTAHRVYGPERTTRAGAAMIPLAFQILAEEAEALGIPPHVRGALALDLAEGAGARGMVGGQVLDLETEAGADEAALRELHLRKTAALLVAAARIGARAAGASVTLIEAAGAYARELGLAFQSRDDALDTGEAAQAQSSAQRAVRLGEAAIVRLRSAGIGSPVLEALARFAAERDR